MPVSVKIDKETCIGCGACTATAPDIFELGDDGKAQLVEQYRTASPAEGEIPDEMKELAESAANTCPVAAITVG